METKYIDLVINRLTQAQYDELKLNNQISEEELYVIVDHDDLFYYKSDLYTKEEINSLLENISPVQANPELIGGESILDSITIDGVNYQVYPEGTIEFDTNKSTDASALTLRSIKVGNDIWNIPSDGGSGGNADLTDYYTKDQVDTAILNSKQEILNGASIDFDTLKEVENWITDDTSGGAALATQVGNLSTELQLKANTADVYNKTEIDAMITGGGSSVIANPELDGGEEILESIQIEDTKYTLQGQDMTFSESISVNPDAKILKTITIGTDDWKVDKGSIVVPNVELTGEEDVLESVKIDDSTFTLKGEEMIFSENPIEGATTLRSVKLGDDNWAIPEVNMDNIYTKEEIDTQFSSFTPVNANPELTGKEAQLNSITIDGVDYSLYGNTLILNTEGVTGASNLGSITINGDSWNITGDNDLALENYYTKQEVNTLVPNIVYSETEPENPTLGMIWLKPAQ